MRMDETSWTFVFIHTGPTLTTWIRIRNSATNCTADSRKNASIVSKKCKVVLHQLWWKNSDITYQGFIYSVSQCGLRIYKMPILDNGSIFILHWYAVESIKFLKGINLSVLWIILVHHRPHANTSTELNYLFLFSWYKIFRHSIGNGHMRIRFGFFPETDPK